VIPGDTSGYPSDITGKKTMASLLIEYLPAGIVPITLSKATCNNTLKANRAGLYVIE